MTLLKRKTGELDWTAAWQRAAAKGGLIELPEGRLDHCGTVTLQSGTYVRGCGKKSIVWSNTPDCALAFASKATDITVEQFALAGLCEIGVLLMANYQCALHRLWIGAADPTHDTWAFGRAGIVLEGTPADGSNCAAVTMTGLHIGATRGNGIELAGPVASSLVQGCRIDWLGGIGIAQRYCSPPEDAAGMGRNAVMLAIHANVIEGCRRGSISLGFPLACIIMGNHFEEGCEDLPAGQRTHVRLGHGTYGLSTVVQANNFGCGQGNVDYGLDCRSDDYWSEGLRYSTVTNNRFVGMGKAAIRLGGIAHQGQPDECAWRPNACGGELELLEV